MKLAKRYLLNDNHYHKRKQVLFRKKLNENHLYLMGNAPIISLLEKYYRLGRVMYVCICHSVTDKAIKKCVRQGHDTLEAIQCELKVGTCCGRCKPHAQEVIEEALKPKFFSLDLLGQEAFA